MIIFFSSQDQNLPRNDTLDLIPFSQGSTQSDTSAEIKVLQPGLRITKKTSNSEKQWHYCGFRLDGQSRVNVQHDADVRPTVENNPKLCLKPVEGKTLRSEVGSELNLDCGLDSCSISEDIGSVMPGLELESLSELRIESPSELNVEAAYEPAVAANLQPMSFITQTTNLESKKGPTRTTILHNIINSNGTGESGSDLSLPFGTKENQEHKTLTESKKRTGPFTPSDQNLTPVPGSHLKAKSGIGSNPETLPQSSKTLRTGSILGDKNPESESNQNKIRIMKSRAEEYKTICPQSICKFNLPSDPSPESVGDAKAETKSGEQQDLWTGLDLKSPGSQPNPRTMSDLKNDLKSAENKTSKTGLSSDLFSEPEGLRIETPPDSPSTVPEDQKSPVDTKNLQPDTKCNSKEFRNLLSEIESNGRQNQPAIDPPPRPKQHQADKFSSRPKDASTVDTRIFGAESESQVR